MKEFEYKLKLAEALARKGRISRRDFVQLALAAGLTAPVATSMFTSAARAEPKKGGTLRIGIGHGATTDSLDPGTYPDQMTGTALWGTASNSLTEVDTKGNITGDLAESYESSDGAKKWVFKLRKGVEFHNGKTVTPNDVLASFRHHMGKDSKSAAKTYVEAIEDIKVDGDNVVFILKGGNADFPYIASDYHIPIMPAKDDGSADWQSGVRTGPYKLDKWEPGVRAQMSRNANYYRPTWFDAVTFTVIPDVSSRTNALTTGEVDYIDRCDLKTLNMLQRNANLEIDKVTGYGHYIFVMNSQVAPFDNKDVRNALKYAIDREDIAAKVFSGINKPANDNPIAPSIKYAIDPQPVHKYDPEMAKSLLKKAGLSSLKVDLSTADAAFAGAVDSATLYKAHAAAAGIDINVISEPSDSYWDNVWLKKPFAASYWNGRPVQDLMFTVAYKSDAAWNDTGFKNKRFDELLEQARSETDDAKRAAQYAEMQQLVHDDGGLINLCWSTYVNAHSKALAHGELATNWDLDGQKIAQRWWFA
ncbi:MAG: ABC transporter substrate-binding protein [Hyphomicrobiales bacterium]